MNRPRVTLTAIAALALAASLGACTQAGPTGPSTTPVAATSTAAPSSTAAESPSETASPTPTTSADAVTPGGTEDLGSPKADWTGEDAGEAPANLTLEEFKKQVAAAEDAIKYYRTIEHLQNQEGDNPMATITADTVTDRTDASNIKRKLDLSAGSESLSLIQVGNIEYHQVDASGQFMRQEYDPAEAELLELSTNKAYTVGTAIEYVGPEEVAGAPAAHYKVTLAGGANPDTIMNEEDIVIDYWIDGKARIVRQESTRVQPGYTHAERIIRGEFDKPVTIDEPTPDQILEG